MQFQVTYKAIITKKITLNIEARGEDQIREHLESIQKFHNFNGSMLDVKVEIMNFQELKGDYPPDINLIEEEE